LQRLEEIRSRLAELKTEITTLGENAEITDDEARSLDEKIAEFDTLSEEAKPLEERAAKLAEIAAMELRTEKTFEAPHVAVRQDDPFGDLDAVRVGYRIDGKEMRARALRAIDEDKSINDEHRNQAYKLIEKDGKGDIARHALLTGSPEYRSAFEKVIQNPMTYTASLTPGEGEALRAALSTTVANGGYAIPFLLDPTIILTNDGSANPFRQISRVVSGTSNKWNGVTSSGVTAEWKTEGSQAADASPTLGQPSITAYLADAYVFGSYEVFQDTDLASELPGLIADAKDRLEADAFAVGSGSGAPFGVVTSTTAITASRVSPTTAGTFTSASIADVYKTLAALPPRHRSKASHVANYATYNIIRQMSASAAGSSFWANLGANVPEALLGRPVYEASAMASAMTTGSNILLTGDFSQYYIYDRIGMSLEYIPNVVGANARPTGQRGWFATWRVGADVVNANAFRVLKL
jgi:HK97 family phage major capsid protein